MEKNYRAELTGVFGDPVDGNPTGVMEEAAYDALGLNYRYITMLVKKDDFPDAFRAVKAVNMKGVNLTMPYKLQVIPYLDELTQAAEIIGAVNTVIVREDGTLLGENTDGKGFVEALARAGFSTEGKKISILGAGGAARAIAVECALAGAAKLTIINRSAGRAAELAALIRDKTPADSEALALEPRMRVPEGTNILINATSIGLAPDSDKKPDLDYDSITAGCMRRGVQSRRHALPGRGGKARSQNRQRSWDARLPGGKELHPLDRQGSSPRRYGSKAPRRVFVKR